MTPTGRATNGKKLKFVYAPVRCPNCGEGGSPHWECVEIWSEKVKGGEVTTEFDCRNCWHHWFETWPANAQPDFSWLSYTVVRPAATT